VRRTATALALLVTLALAACGDDDDSGQSEAGTDKGQMILATTTSTQDSGLLDELLPRFQDESGCSVKTVAVGSGEALELGEKGDADVLLVHSPEAEQEYMDGGHGASREAVMHNDFIVVGPEDDPA
jgi:tungstate transport system substrate-binding protein